jgi:hypothetical protein
MTVSSLFGAIINWFEDSAPPVGQPDADAIPEGSWYDPLGAARAGHFTTDPVHTNEAGYLPSWKFVAPPGVGDAPQHVFSTWTAFPLSLDGPGDKPATYLRIGQQQTIANFAMRWQGIPAAGGNVLMTGLYTPMPMDSMANDITGG